MSYLTKIINCDKCNSLGIDYAVERKDNLDFAYHYKPEIIKYLWIVESPPFSYPPRYFYRPELTRYDSLFREVMKYLNIVPSNPKEKSLLEFKEKGHFVIDSAKCPVDKENSHSKPKMIDNCSDLLKREVLSLRPKNILIIKSNIYSQVFKLLTEIGFHTKVINDSPIPFPGSGQQVRFRNAIAKYLELRTGINDSKFGQKSTIQKRMEIVMDSVLITNITAKDAKAKKIRITVDNKPIFPSERIGHPQTYHLTFSLNDEVFENITYTIGSRDMKSRSGILKLVDELYIHRLKIREGTTLIISKIGLHHYKIDRFLNNAKNT